MCSCICRVSVLTFPGSGTTSSSWCPLPSQRSEWHLPFQLIRGGEWGQLNAAILRLNQTQPSTRISMRGLRSPWWQAGRLDFNMLRTYRLTWMIPSVAWTYIGREEEMRLSGSQAADCLPVVHLLLHSSSQVQVCVGSERLLSDDSNSRCALAHFQTHIHVQKGNTQLYPYTHKTLMDST